MRYFKRVLPYVVELTAVTIIVGILAVVFSGGGLREASHANKAAAAQLLREASVPVSADILALDVRSESAQAYELPAEGVPMQGQYFDVVQEQESDLPPLADVNPPSFDDLPGPVLCSYSIESDFPPARYVTCSIGDIRIGGGFEEGVSAIHGDRIIGRLFGGKDVLPGESGQRVIIAMDVFTDGHTSGTAVYSEPYTNPGVADATPDFDDGTWESYGDLGTEVTNHEYVYLSGHCTTDAYWSVICTVQMSDFPEVTLWYADYPGIREFSVRVADVGWAYGNARPEGTTYFTGEILAGHGEVFAG